MITNKSIIPPTLRCCASGRSGEALAVLVIQTLCCSPRPSLRQFSFAEADVRVGSQPANVMLLMDDSASMMSYRLETPPVSRSPPARSLSSTTRRPRTCLPPMSSCCGRRRSTRFGTTRR